VKFNQRLALKNKLFFELPNWERGDFLTLLQEFPVCLLEAVPQIATPLPKRVIILFLLICYRETFCCPLKISVIVEDVQALSFLALVVQFHLSEEEGLRSA
jgi:hypothetical protein